MFLLACVTRFIDEPSNHSRSVTLAAIAGVTVLIRIRPRYQSATLMLSFGDPGKTTGRTRREFYKK